jgi:hypothetical protein
MGYTKPRSFKSLQHMTDPEDNMLVVVIVNPKLLASYAALWSK